MASASATADADELFARTRAPGGALNVLKTRFSASAKNTICAGCLTLIRMHRFFAVRSRLWHWRRHWRRFNLSLAVSMTPRSIPKKSAVMFPNDRNCGLVERPVTTATAVGVEDVDPSWAELQFFFVCGGRPQPFLGSSFRFLWFCVYTYFRNAPGPFCLHAPFWVGELVL